MPIKNRNSSNFAFHFASFFFSIWIKSGQACYFSLQDEKPTYMAELQTNLSIFISSKSKTDQHRPMFIFPPFSVAFLLKWCFKKDLNLFEYNLTMYYVKYLLEYLLHLTLSFPTNVIIIVSKDGLLAYKLHVFKTLNQPTYQFLCPNAFSPIFHLILFLS